MNDQFQHSRRLINLLPRVAEEGMQSFDRFCILAMEAFRVTNISGDIVEMGCHKGNSARWLRECCPEKRMWLYDTFEGQPEDGEGFHKGAMKAEKLEWLDDDQFTVVVRMDIRYIGAGEKSLLPQKIALAHLDMDGYSSLLHGLYLCWPRMVPGGVIIVDDYHDPNYPGAKRAVDDFSKLKDFENSHIEHVPGCAGRLAASVVIRR